MKIILIRLQIFFILLLVFSPLIYLTSKQFMPRINLWRYDLAHKNEADPLVPWLSTQNRNIVDTDNHPVVLRGVNLISTNWGASYVDWNPQAINIATRDWHVNVIRTRIYEHEFVENPGQFFLDLEQQILEPARQNGLYVILHPWFGENVSLPDADGIRMWLAVTRRYSDDPHIIYDLLAEPRDLSFAELKATYAALIPQIRAISPDSLIMVTGLDWGRDINAWLDEPLAYPNLVYRANPYNKTAEFPGYFGRIAQKYPVFLGEFGTDDKLSMTQSDVKNILGYASALNLGWAAWHFTATGCPCLLADESNFTPSPSGVLVKEALLGTSYPFTLPTFDTDPTRLYVYSDFLESGFADYSWGITNQFGAQIQTNFHNAAGLYLNTSRRLNPQDYLTFHLTLQTSIPNAFTLRFKSFDNQLSHSFTLKNGENSLASADIGLTSISGIILETKEIIPDPTPLSLDQIYFQK